MKISKINNIILFKQGFKKNTSKSPVFSAFSTSNFDIFHNNNSLLNLSLINFQGKKVDKKVDFIDNFKKLLNSDNPDEIFLFLDKELRKKAQEKGIMSEIIDDVVQNAILDILLIFEAFNNGEISNDELISSVNEIYLNLKAKKEDYVSDYATTSLDRAILDGNKTIVDTISDDEKYKIKYLTPADDKKRQADKKRLQEKLDSTDLSDKEKEFLLSRENEDGKVSYKKIGQKQGVSTTVAYKTILSAIYKIKKKQNRLTKDDLKNINDVVERFKKYGLTFDDYLNTAINEPQLFSQDADKIETRINGVVDNFKDYGLTHENYLSVCLKQPQLFYQSPETICGNIEGVVNNFKDYGLTYENYLSACINQPQLFYQSPETICANVSGVVNNFKDYGLTHKNYLPACIKQSRLFSQSPKTICANVSGVVDNFKDYGLTYKKYLPACIKQPSLFSQSPKTICTNVSGVVNNFKDYGLTYEKYLPACLNRAQLFYQSPKTICANVSGLVNYLKDYGLTYENYLPVCIKQPSLFTQSPKTIYTNISDVVDNFKDYGLTLKNYLPACINQPQLFYQSPKTICANVSGVVNNFKDYGLTYESYLPACINQPQLFSQSPETICANVSDVVDNFKDYGLTYESYLPACIKQPSLFTQSPKTVTEHIKALIFIYKNIDEKLTPSEIMEKVSKKYVRITCTNKTNYGLLLRKKMFPNKAPKGLGGEGKINSKIENYLKENPNSKFSFTIKDDEMAQEFVEYARELAKNAIDREDVFDITIE